MKTQTVAALAIVVVGALGIGLWFTLKPAVQEWYDTRTSNSRITTTLRIGGDGYLGYWFIQSPEMRKESARRGVGIDFKDDGGAYTDRLQKFAAGELDVIVLPVNSYAKHGGNHKYPGVIVAAIAESKGADGIVAFKESLRKDGVPGLNDSGLKFVYTGESPSSFLLDLTITDFDLFNLAKSSEWRSEVAGSTEAFKAAGKREGDVFVMWEPELSKALAENPDLTYVWGSDKFGGYIIDVFVVRRDYLQHNEETLKAFFKAYFTAVDRYANDPKLKLSHIKKSTGLKNEVAEAILGKIDWYDFDENLQDMFGITRDAGYPAKEGVVNCIISCNDVMVRTDGSYKGLDDPYRIVNDSTLRSLTEEMPKAVNRDRDTRLAFVELSDDEWAELPEIATMRVEPITFGNGVDRLDTSGESQVDKIASVLLNNYPSYRVAVRGHTGPGDEEANLKLSKERAEVVVQRLIAVHRIDPDRLKAEGLGSSKPPELHPGESYRALRYRMPRVEFVLIKGNRI